MNFSSKGCVNKAKLIVICKHKTILTLTLKSRMIPFKLLSRSSCLKLSYGRYCSTHTDSTFKLKMLTKSECQLCDEALDAINNQIPKDLLKKITIEKVDIEEDEALFDRWRYEIPVFFINDKYLCRHRIDVDLLLSKINLENTSKWFTFCHSSWCPIHPLVPCLKPSLGHLSRLSVAP